MTLQDLINLSLSREDLSSKKDELIDKSINLDNKESMGSGSIDHALRMPLPRLIRHITALLLLLTLTPLPLFAAETAPADKHADKAFEARVSKLLKESQSSPLEETVARVRKGLEGVPPSTLEGQEAVTRYYQRKYQGLKTDVSELHALLEKAAAKGDSEAMVILGLLVYSGQGVFPDHERGLKLLNRARDLGNPAASFHLAYTHFDEYSAKFDFDTARKYLKEAKKRGHAMANYGWAQLLEKKRRFREAREIYLEYAGNRYPQAYVNLAYLYIRGEGVKRNSRTGTTLLRTATNFDWSDAIYHLGLTYLSGINGQENDKLLLKHLSDAANLNNPDSLYSLCTIYANRNPKTADNYNKSLAHCRESSNFGSMLGASEMALFYIDGKHNDDSVEEYTKWSSIAISRGGCVSIFRKARDLLYGNNGSPKDINKAYSTFKETALRGYPPGMLIYAFLSSESSYDVPDLPKPDYPECYIWSTLYVRALGIHAQTKDITNTESIRTLCKERMSENRILESNKFIALNSLRYTSNFWARFHIGSIINRNP